MSPRPGLRPGASADWAARRVWRRRGRAPAPAAPRRLPRPARAHSRRKLRRQGVQAWLPKAHSSARVLPEPRSYNASSRAPGRVGIVSGTPQGSGLCSRASLFSDKDKAQWFAWELPTLRWTPEPWWVRDPG